MQTPPELFLQPGQHVLLTKYPPGATIRWHKDRAVFARVIGLSLNAPCTFRFRCKAGAKWQRVSFTAEPRSAYLLDGGAHRMGAQHSGGAGAALFDHIPHADVIGIIKSAAATPKAGFFRIRSGRDAAIACLNASPVPVQHRHAIRIAAAFARRRRTAL